MIWQLHIAEIPMKIGHLAKLVDCTPETIRFYESKGLLSRPRRTPSGYREYERRHVKELVFARHCRSLGLTLEEVSDLLELQRSPEHGCDDANRLIDQRIGEVKAQIASLSKLGQLLEGLRAKCDDSRSSKDCGILRMLAETAT